MNEIKVLLRDYTDNLHTALRSLMLMQNCDTESKNQRT